MCRMKKKERKTNKSAESKISLPLSEKMHHFSGIRDFQQRNLWVVGKPPVFDELNGRNLTPKAEFNILPWEGWLPLCPSSSLKHLGDQNNSRLSPIVGPET